MISSIGSAGASAVSFDPAEMRGRRFAKMDANSDGSLDQGELSSLVDKLSQRTGATVDATSLFQTLDTDGSGAIAESELDFRTLMEGVGMKPPAHGRVHPFSPGEVQTRMFEKADGNGDSALDETELTSITDKLADLTGSTVDASSLFQTLDADGNGAIGQSEFDFRTLMESVWGRASAVRQYESATLTDAPLQIDTNA